jgi:hypothetical protein
MLPGLEVEEMVLVLEMLALAIADTSGYGVAQCRAH